MGRVVSNDGGIRTERDPDTVRGGDVAYYSYARVPQGPLPAGYLDVVPDWCSRSRSPTDRWSRLITKAGEYLEAGVTVVCLLDQVSETVQVYRAMSCRAPCTRMTNWTCRMSRRTARPGATLLRVTVARQIVPGLFSSSVLAAS